MRICFVTRGAPGEYRANEGADVHCFGLYAMEEVSYERELKGETNAFEEVARLSKQCGVVVCGCRTNARGIRRKSVVVADRGRILGVTDMVNRIDGEEYSGGAGIRVFDTAAGRLGVVVAEDLYFPQVCETLARCGADLLLSVFGEVNESLETTLIRAWAFAFGVPVCLCAYGYAACADPRGKLRFAASHSPCAFQMGREQEYHLVETRRKMTLRRKNSY